MGRDIYIAAQRQDAATGRWITFARDTEPCAELGPRWYRWPREPDWRVVGERCWLAWERLAGVTTIEGVEPLFPGRGTPDDPDGRVGCLYDTTWTTLAELLAADWSPAEGTGLVLWLRSPEVAALAERWGADRVRFLFGFD